MPPRHTRVSVSHCTLWLICSPIVSDITKTNKEAGTRERSEKGNRLLLSNRGAFHSILTKVIRDRKRFNDARKRLEAIKPVAVLSSPLQATFEQLKLTEVVKVTEFTSMPEQQKHSYIP